MQSIGLNTLADARAVAGATLGAASTGYNDLQSLQGLKRGNGSIQREALPEIGRQFESLLVHQMLKSMRNASKVWSEGGLLSSGRVDFYQGMMDDQLSLELVKGRGLGLSEQFTHDLQSRFASAAQAGNEDARADVAVEPMRAQHRVEDVAATKLHRQFGGGSIYKPDTANVSTAIASPVAVDVTHALKAGYKAGQVEDKKGAEKREVFSSAADFVAELKPLAEQAAARLGVPAEAILAQAALETGWGTKIIQHSDGRNSHNLFGIKSDRRWQGEEVAVDTLEYFADKPVRVRAAFRSYQSFAQSFDDYVEFIRSNERYKTVTDDPQNYAHALQHAGYATDPAYAEKIQSIASRFDKYPGVKAEAPGNQNPLGDHALVNSGNNG